MVTFCGIYYSPPRLKDWHIELLISALPNCRLLLSCPCLSFIDWTLYFVSHVYLGYYLPNTIDLNENYIRIFNVLTKIRWTSQNRDILFIKICLLIKKYSAVLFLFLYILYCVFYVSQEQGLDRGGIEIFYEINKKWMCFLVLLLLQLFAAVIHLYTHLPKHTAIASFEKHQGRAAKKLYKNASQSEIHLDFWSSWSNL